MTRSFRAVMFGAGIAALAITWLLPNHNQPWLSFHSDAWIAIALLTVAFVIQWFGHRKASLSAFAFLPCALIGVVCLQFAVGKITFFGDAWIACLYLLGFLAAFVIGSHGQGNFPGRLGDLFFAAAALAALASLCIQLCQWFGLYPDDLLSSIWILNVSSARPSGNLGQPNQLATLLILGGLGIGWFCLRGKLSGTAWWLLSLPIVFGIALTQSRTGGATLVLLALFIWYYRSVLPYRNIVWAVWGLISAYVLFFFAVDAFNSSGSAVNIFHGEPSLFVSRANNETRLEIWEMFFGAVLRMPWFGYGWGNTSLAQLDVALDYSGLRGVTFRHTHNLFLDLMLFVGIPLGFATAIAIIWSVFRWARRIQKPSEVVLLLSLLPFGVHSMLELPLYYAYFLLPAGLLAGMLSVSVESPKFTLRLPRWAGWVLLFVCTTMLTITVVDYFRIESAYTALRFEKARIGSKPNAVDPSVIALTQLRDLIRYARMDPQDAVPAQTLAWMEAVTSANPSLPNGLRLIRAFALSGEPEEATRWMRKLCAVVPREQCIMGKAAWGEYQTQNDKLMVVMWP